MTTSNFRAANALTPQARPKLYWTSADALVLAKRHLIQIPRIPEELIFATIQPIIFVLLFRYVFGGAIAIPGTSYVNYLMAGIFAQTVIFGAMSTGIGLATDLQRGLVDRFRSLPMAKSAVLTGRTIADIVRNTFIVFVMWTVGLLVNAVRGLLLNKPDVATIGQAVAWCVGILVVFIPLSVWAYGRRTAR